MKGLINWLIVAGIGFALMAFSYFNYQYQPGPNLWKDAFMYIGKADPNSEAEGIKYVKRPIRLLPISPQAQKFTKLARNFGSAVEKSYCVQFQEKLILYSDMATDFKAEMLKLGRLPNPGANEVVAGYYASSKDEIAVDGQVFEVVGQFKKEVRLFVDSYLFGDSAAAGELFNPAHDAVQNAYILQLPREQLVDSQVREQLKKAFPKSQFAAYAPLIRTKQVPFYLYILGMALLFLGGSVVLFKVYCILADRIDNKWLRLPLDEIHKFRCLFLGLHLVYFGVVVLFMLLAHTLPEFQVCLLGGIKAQVADGSGPLGVAGKAYMSKSIPMAAVVTLLINFFLGSLAYITIPSIIIPGVGILAAVFRASMWGLLLAPNFDVLAGTMLPHSFTILLEGEGYVLASFFGLLILVYLFRKAEGLSLAGRYGRALLMNVRGNLLVAMVLTIAAIYEAIEVILIAMKD
jgi:hypothetical protein